MWLSVTKILGYLASPFSVGMSLALLAVICLSCGWRRIGWLSGVGSLLVLWICSTPVLEGKLRQHLEIQYPPIAIESVPVTDYIVVLGGAVAAPYPPRLEIELHGSSDRVLHAARLYHAGRAPVILVAAGNVFGDRVEHPEAVHISSLLQEWGVPPERILLESNSRTTRENAVQTRRLLEDSGEIDASVLLVTSATHMPRAMATFEAVGLNVFAATTDSSAGPALLPDLFAYMPSAEALLGMTRLWHELLGTWVYRLRGWI